MMLAGYAKYNRKRKTKKKYAPVTIQYADGTKEVITAAELRADGGLRKRRRMHKEGI